MDNPEVPPHSVGASSPSPPAIVNNNAKSAGPAPLKMPPANQQTVLPQHGGLPVAPGTPGTPDTAMRINLFFILITSARRLHFVRFEGVKRTNLHILCPDPTRLLRLSGGDRR